MYIADAECVIIIINYIVVFKKLRGKLFTVIFPCALIYENTQSSMIKSTWQTAKHTINIYT